MMLYLILMHINQTKRKKNLRNPLGIFKKLKLAIVVVRMRTTLS